MSQDKIKKYPPSLETRVALVEVSMIHIREILERIEKRFDKIDEKFDKVDEKFDNIDKKFDEMRKDMKFDFRFLLGAICALGAIMAHGFHWY